MGADIHVFTEIKLPDDPNLVNIDYFRFTKEGDTEGYNRLEAYEGRYSVLFDVLRHKIPQNGYPKNPSKIFKKEWESWYGHGVYGLNHISLQDLYKFWRKSMNDVYINSFCYEDMEFTEALALYPFLNDLVNHYVSFYYHQFGSHFNINLNKKDGNNVYVIYFFDR